MLEIRGLSFSYGARAGAVLRSVDLELGAGEIGVLLGRSGSGKTTLFKNILRAAQTLRQATVMP